MRNKKIGTTMLGFSGKLSTAQKRAGIAAATLFVLALAYGFYEFFPGATNQGYAPKQPIPYSHKLHAGDLKIDCKYCHVAATKSIHASVPSLNICMNCHSVVKLDSPHVQKMHQLYNEGKPVEWVRVHELPDHVRFNHKRHVAKGVKCETCHGDIRKMEVVFQQEELTMGWCLKCHRGQTTPSSIRAKVAQSVDKNSNYHKGEIAPFNCAVCHY